MNYVLVCDWLDAYAGAEHVIKDMAELYTPSRIYTLANVMSAENLKTMGIDSVKIEKSFLRLLGRKFRYGLPLFPLAIKTLGKRVPAGSAILSSSHSAAKGFYSEGCLHICYMQARNMKYIWEEKDAYFRTNNFIMNGILDYLRRWDLQAAKNPDYMIANSKFVAGWIKDKYNREAVVIYPPVEIEEFIPVNRKDSYYIYVGRLAPYKRVDIIVKAFNEMEHEKLIVVGDGSDRRKLEAMAGSNTRFIGFRKRRDVTELVGKAKCFIIANAEDFGIAMVEAQACATPVIAYADGGALEIIKDGTTGILFCEQTPDAIKGTVREFDKIEHSFDPSVIRKNAERFNEVRFKEEFKNFVDDKINSWKGPKSTT